MSGPKTKENQIKYFLRHIGEANHNPECRRRQFCPKNADCGQCRYDYMKKRVWL